jgi:O-antigen/teichoic acid export membrane protein
LSNRPSPPTSVDSSADGIAVPVDEPIVPPGLGAADTAAETAAAVPQPEDAQVVGRNVTVLAMSQLITWTMTLLWTLVVPRSLGPSGMGTIMTAWSVTGILGVVLGLGTRAYLVRESVVAPEERARLVGTALVLRIVLTPLVVGAAIAYGELSGWGRHERLVLYLAAAATVFVQIAEPLQAAFQSIERMEYLAYSDVINKSAQGLLGIVVVLAGAGTIGVMTCWLTMTAVVLVLDAYWLRGLVHIDVHTSVKRMLRMARASLPYWAFGVFFMVYLWIDFVMLSLITNSEVVGWYSVPTRLFQTLMFLPVVVATAFLPKFVRGFEEGGDRLRQSAQAPTELVLLLSLPIAAGTAMVARPLIHLLYGSAYDESVAVMVVLGICIPPMYLNIMLSQILIAMNRQAMWTWVMAGTTVVNPLLNLALIPWTQHRYGNGAIGAGISLLLTELICIGAGFWMIGRHVFGRGTVRRTLIGTFAAGSMWAVYYVTEGSIGAIPALIAGVLTFVVLAAVLRLFTREEIGLIRTGLEKVARKVPGLSRFAPSPAANAPPPA